MEPLLMTLALLAIVSYLLKIGFWSWKWQLAMAAVAAAVVFLLTPQVTELSRDALSQMTSARPVLLNLAVLAVAESALMVAWCFTGRRLFYCYPGLLALGAFSYFQAQLLFRQPGIDFSLAAWLSALGVALLSVGGSRLLGWALGPRAFRQELLFIVNLLIVLLCVVLTGF